MSRLAPEKWPESGLVRFHWRNVKPWANVIPKVDLKSIG